MSRPLTIRWEERDQVWQAPAGEFYVDGQGCGRRREIVLRYPGTGQPVARDDREGAWAALVHVLEILIGHPQPIEREAQPIQLEVQSEAQPIASEVQVEECDPCGEYPSSPEPAVEVKIEPAVEVKVEPASKSESKSEPKTKSKYAAASKGEAASLDIDPGWFDLDQRRDRIIASLVGIIQDPGESSRERLGALNALIRLDKQIRHERHLKGQQDPSEEAAAIVKAAILRMGRSQSAQRAKAEEN